MTCGRQCRIRGNPFYTVFKYSPVSGIGKDESKLSVSRRDPSKVLKIGDTYYVWYTRRRTENRPVGRFNIEQGDDETPIVDWDLADICYATSKDGFNWVEQGVAVPRAPKGNYGDRSLSTPRYPRIRRALLSLLSVLHDHVAAKRLRQREYGLVGFS